MPATRLYAQSPLPGTQALTMEGDLSIRMVDGIGRFFESELARSVASRAPHWQMDLSSRTAYEKSAQPNRERLARIIGAVDARRPNPEMEHVATVSMPGKVAETDRFIAYAVRWPVMERIYGEGLLLQPKGRVVARVVALPDADQVPEVIAGMAPGLPAGQQYARRLAENGCQVIIPTLVDRAATFSGSPLLNVYTNQPHREWIYRQAYFLGRHVIGYEVQKVLSAVDWLVQQNRDAPVGIGVAGWGEGALLAFYSAALDIRIDSVVVSGYFGKRETLWQEPIYRNVFGLLKEFGDAEIAQMIVPRSLIVEHAPAPDIQGPPRATGRSGRGGAAPGRIVTLEYADVRAEIERTKQLTGPFGAAIQLHPGNGALAGPLAEATLLSFLKALSANVAPLEATGQDPKELRTGLDVVGRQQRQVSEMEGYTQQVLHRAVDVREEFLWKKVSAPTQDAWREAMKVRQMMSPSFWPPTSPYAWNEAMQPYREKMWNEVIGRFPTGQVPLNARTRLIHDRPAWTCHEVVLDVLPDVYAWGYYLLPKGIKLGEKRPVVVTQHGLEGVPDDTITDDARKQGFGYYKAFAVRLAERGFIVFSPHNPYRGRDLFRVLQRKANPLGKSLFSVIIAQHDCILDWLVAQPAVDSARIGYYGLSYGGKSAMRVPAVLDRFALSVCSGDFNEWTWKNVSTDFSRSYMFSSEYEMPDFNLGMTFGYAEMAALIAPRPFMVERGHNDTVGIDEWVAYEYAKVNRLYSKLKIPQLTEIEYFDGPHTINGVGTYKFLHRHLKLPEPGLPFGADAPASKPESDDKARQQSVPQAARN